MGTFVSIARLNGMGTGPLGLAARWLRGLGGVAARPEAELRLEARLSLGPKKQLVLVNCCGKKVLLALSGDNVSTVMEVAEPRKASRARKEAEL